MHPRVRSWIRCCRKSLERCDIFSEGAEQLRIMKLEVVTSSFLPTHGPVSIRARNRSRWGCGLFAVIGSLLCIVLVMQLKHLYSEWTDGGASYRHYEETFVQGVCNDSLSRHLKEVTKEPHVAGSLQNYHTATYVYESFTSYGINTHYTDYEVLLSYPLQRSLYLSGVDGLEGGFDLEEADVEGDPYTKDPSIMSTFHGYSPSGNVSGEVVYANYGAVADFKELVRMGVNVSGAIVIARYGGIYRGDIVRNAELYGASGVIIFSDPWDYAANNTHGFYPDSEWLPPTGVQRGTVYRGVGDPLTPGWASTPGAEKAEAGRAGLPRIPSLPISGRDAQRILRGLEGKDAPLGWHGGLGLDCYRIGRGPARLNLTYVATQAVYPIRNVIGIIEGSEEPDRYVLLGNHRDAWVFGAVDPGSGTASLLELARGFGGLLRQGWRPRRSIILASWDAEEYGMIGSTEWVEENLNVLGARAVAYLNVDCAAAGPGFFASATPQLDLLLQDITREVKDPDGNFATVFDAWQAMSSTGVPPISRLGKGDSDFVAFLQYAGVPSVDLHYGDDYPVYHSEYDDFEWMEKFGDPLFKRHVAITSIWGILALRLADETVLPFDFGNYAKELQNYVHEVSVFLQQAEAPPDVTVNPLYAALADLLKSAALIRQEVNMLESFRPDTRELFYFLLRRRAINDRLMLAERAFLHQDGLPGQGRAWFKHLVYGPTVNNYYGNTNFPGILDKISDASAVDETLNWRAVQHEIWRVARAISGVAAVLRGGLS